MFNVNDIIKKNNLFTKKKFGQNFLIDNAILDKIVNVSGNIKNKNILEIGPGPGGLTNSILKKFPKKLISIEIDNYLYEIIKIEFSSYKNFEILNKDALKINEAEIFKDGKINIIANLPYNIGTQLLIKWIKNLEIFESFTLLLQKEVVERIVALPHTKEYGRLSIIVQAFCDVKKAFDIKPTSFIPAPKVMSSVIEIKPKINIDFINIDNLSFITFELFSKRRKKIKNVIENLINNNKMNSNVLEFLNLNKRAEEISVNEFIELSKNIKN